VNIFCYALFTNPRYVFANRKQIRGHGHGQGDAHLQDVSKTAAKKVRGRKNHVGQTFCVAAGSTAKAAQAKANDAQKPTGAKGCKCKARRRKSGQGTCALSRGAVTPMSGLAPCYSGHRRPHAQNRSWSRSTSGPVLRTGLRIEEARLWWEKVPNALASKRKDAKRVVEADAGRSANPIAKGASLICQTSVGLQDNPAVKETPMGASVDCKLRSGGGGKAIEEALARDED